MKEFLLIIAVLGVFVFGFYIMKCVDDFLYENYKNIHADIMKSEPSCIMLTDGMSEEEIIKEIRKFKEKHETVGIYLSDKESGIDMPEYFTNE